MRLNKVQANFVKRGLIESLQQGKFIHPDRISNEFNGIWINDQQKRAYLRRLAEAGKIRVRYHSRGWYSWNTYAPLESEEKV